MPTSQTLICRTASTLTTASGEGAIAAGGFGRRFIRPDYRLPPQPFQGTPGILMLSYLARSSMPANVVTARWVMTSMLG